MLYIYIYIYNFARDKEAHIHRLKFFFLSLVTYHFLVFLKFEQNTWKNYPFCKINSQCRKTESLKRKFTTVFSVSLHSSGCHVAFQHTDIDLAIHRNIYL